MKRVLFFLTLMLMVGAAVAQPPQRRAEQQEKQANQQKNASSAMSMRAQISYPTAVDMPEDVVWRRDIYREISLDEDANGGLYYPVEPQGKQLNLFTYIGCWVVFLMLALVFYHSHMGKTVKLTVCLITIFLNVLWTAYLFNNFLTGSWIFT